jgi:hypothetical protein
MFVGDRGTAGNLAAALAALETAETGTANCEIGG